MNQIKLFAVLPCAILLLAARSVGADYAIPTPGGAPQDRFSAFFEPDQYAWRLFLSLSRQADPGSPGTPDAKYPNLTHFDSDAPVVWGKLGISFGRPQRPFSTHTAESK